MSDEEMTRETVQDIAETAAFKIMYDASDLLPHDLSTKEGRDAFRADMRHNHERRIACDKVKDIAGKAAIKILVRGTFILIIFGILYILGVNPHKINSLLNK